MNYNTTYNKILTDENMMETIQHGSKEYPFHFYYDNLELFDFHCIEWHWHTEFEFVYVETGTVYFGISDKQFALSEGQGVFINSKILHRYFSQGNAIVPNFVLMPYFIAAQDSLIYQKYVLPIMSSPMDYQIFSQDIPWQAQALSLMREIMAAQEKASDVELVNSYLIQKIWHILYQNTDIEHMGKKENYSASSQARLQLMMQYIHQKSAYNISLSDIADQAKVSKSTALNLFQRYLGISPVTYLINYRLQEAAKLLASTEKKVTVISKDTGFDSVDYFCKAFKKYYKLTPTEYRKKAQ
ncbi:MAG: AraC family transcriptional regulator [Lachnospiraceae bacterium]|nr:AraC family transcriptional regulator [Lachnospiraceae bacterium]